MQRSNTDNAPRSAIHQTLYFADTLFSMIIFAPEGFAILYDPQEGQINWLHFVGINDAALLQTRASEPYGIHELVIEDILSRSSVRKSKTMALCVYCRTGLPLHHHRQAPPDQSVVWIIGKDFLLFSPTKPLDLFSQLRRQMHENPHDILTENTSVSGVLPA